MINELEFQVVWPEWCWEAICESLKKSKSPSRQRRVGRPQLEDRKDKEGSSRSSIRKKERLSENVEERPHTRFQARTKSDHVHSASS